MIPWENDDISLPKFIHGQLRSTALDGDIIIIDRYKGLGLSELNFGFYKVI